MVRFLPPLCWTALIAYLGGSQWSGEHTASWLDPVLRAFLPTASPEMLAVAHVLIRKTAHVIEYAVLAGLWRRGLGSAWAPLALAVLTASLDELHQSFAPGRVGSMADVVLDGAAAAAALGLLALRARLRRTVS